MTTNEIVAAEAPPALFLHCQTVWGLMENESKVVDSGDGVVCIWEGSLTKLVIQQANLSLPLYSQVTKRLKSMNCVVQLRRGGGMTPSVWQLLKEPNYDDYVNCDHERENKPAKANELAQLSQRLSDVNGRTETLEEQMAAMIRLMDKVMKVVDFSE